MRRTKPLWLLCVLFLLLTLTACSREEETKTTELLLTARETPEATSAKPSELAGDWYGWWHITHTDGDWAKLYGAYWDCCARIEDSGALLLWDESLPKDYPLAETALLFDGGGFRCVGGSMLDAAREPERWELALTEDEGGRLLTIRGRYDAVESEGGFSYEIFLRPWGALWPGEPGEIPYYYEDWYLPLIRAGGAMPDTIGP